MTPSLRGGQLPDSLEDFLALASQNRLRYLRCVDCNAPFSLANVHSPAGWRETQISGMCETCFDALFADDETPSHP